MTFIMRTTVGKNGGVILRFKRSCQSIPSKNGWFLISAASAGPEPSRFSGFFSSSYDNKLNIRDRMTNLLQ